MVKIILIPIFVVLFLEIQAQDSVKLFYISKIVASTKDSTRLSQCQSFQYRGSSVKLVFLKNNIRFDSLYKSITVYSGWKDSVMIDIKISSRLYNNSDSIVITPIHKFTCKQKGVRGSISLTSTGEGKNIKNISLKFISDPPAAIVYLIPKIIWKRNPRLVAKDEKALKQYRIAGGITPVSSPVQEYVYIALFKYKDKYIDIQCSPTYKNPIDSVYADFIRK